MRPPSINRALKLSATAWCLAISLCEFLHAESPLPRAPYTIKYRSFTTDQLFADAYKAAQLGDATVRDALDQIKELERRNVADCDLFLLRLFVHFMHDSSPWGKCPEGATDEQCKTARGRQYEHDLHRYLKGQCNETIGYTLRSVIRNEFGLNGAREDLQEAIRREPKVCAGGQFFVGMLGSVPSINRKTIPPLIGATIAAGLFQHNPVSAELCEEQGNRYEKTGDLELAYVCYQAASHAAGPETPRWNRLKPKIAALNQELRKARGEE